MQTCGNYSKSPLVTYGGRGKGYGGKRKLLTDISRMGYIAINLKRLIREEYGEMRNEGWFPSRNNFFGTVAEKYAGRADKVDHRNSALFISA